MSQLQVYLKDLGLLVRLRGMESGSLTATSDDLGLSFVDILLVVLASPLVSVWTNRRLIWQTLAESWQRRGLPPEDHLTDEPITPEQFQALCREQTLLEVPTDHLARETDGRTPPPAH